jgi:chromosome segregation ATPase
MEATANGKVYVFTKTDFEIRSYEQAIRSLRAEKSHLRRWINDHKRMIESAIGWRDVQVASVQVKASLSSIASNELKISKLDITIERWQAEIAKLKASQA